MQADILIKNAIPITTAGKCDGADRVYLTIADGLITGCGPMKDLGEVAAGEVVEADGALVMPGLVNGHCHAAMTLFRGLADDLELMSWLGDHIFPAEAAHVNPAMVYWCSRLAAAEMLLSGTTMVADAYFHQGEAARAFSEAGIRSVSAHGVIDFPAPGVPDPAENIATAARFLDEWEGRDSLVMPAVFAHSPYTCSPATLQKAKELARRCGKLFFIHVAETKSEQKMIRGARGASPVKHLEALGILDEQTVCVHCVWVDEEDIAILAERGCRVIVCPQSNLKLASGMAPLADMRAAGLTVGLGTDGAASNNSLDMFREMDFCAKAQKIRTLDPVGVPAWAILQMASAGGARLFGMPEGWGELRPGSPADLILVRLQVPHLQPFYSPDLLVYAGQGSDVQYVIVDGRIVVKERTLCTIDLEETLARVRQLAASLG